MPRGQRPAARRPHALRRAGRDAPRPLVCVFAKAPEPGRVKTRLIPTLRATEAADLYRALLLDTIDAAETAPADIVVAFAPLAGRRAVERLVGSRRRLMPQGPGDLGARLARAFETLCDERRPVLVVGSDCPGLDAVVLREAARVTSRVDVVLGPARDGGYYLVGMRRPRRELFAGVPWSTPGVLAATRERIAEAGWTLQLLEPLRDLDTPEDLYELYSGAREADLERTYPRTWIALHAMLPPRRLARLEARLRGEPEA